MHPTISETLEYLEQEYAELLDGRCPRHPAGGPTCWHDATDQELRALGKAVDIAPNLTICEALLRGEHVPVDQLDTEGLRRYGRRP